MVAIPSGRERRGFLFGNTGGVVKNLRQDFDNQKCLNLDVLPL
jgi:hypothetical protein